MFRLSAFEGALAGIAPTAATAPPRSARTSQPAIAVSTALPPVLLELELDELACLRGDRLLFAGVTMRVASGELLRVRGHNGAGKTSLLRMVCGLAAPHHGDVRWCGAPVADRRDASHAAVVYLGDGAALNDRLSAHENLLAACAIAGRPAYGADIGAALGEAGVGDCAHLPVRVLSQGQRRRAALARLALPDVAGEAGLWVLDEPFNALDDSAGGWLIGCVRSQLAAGGIVVLTSHQDVDFGAGTIQRVIRL